MKLHKSLCGLFLAALTVCCLFGCQKSEEAQNGGTLTLSFTSNPDNLNPIVCCDSSAMPIFDLVFNTLLKLDEHLEPIPELAESWEVSEDGLIWLFQIRRGVLFHDGEELTAEDVAFTFSSIVDPKNQSPFASSYSMVESFQTQGKYMFKVVLKEPFVPLPALLYDISIVPADIFEEGNMDPAEFGGKPVGTGPFQFVDWREQEIELAANRKYFDGEPRLQKVIFNFYPDKNAAWSALMRAETDLVLDLSQDDYDVIKDDARFITYTYDSYYYYTMLFNLEDPLFSNRMVRTALDIAIDRRDLIESVLEGRGIQTTGPFFPGSWPYNSEIKPREYDPSSAIEILNDLGWYDYDGDRILEKAGEELRIDLLVDKGDLAKEHLAQRISWQLARIGVRTTVKLLDRKELFDEKLSPGKFQAVLLQFNAWVDPVKYFPRFWHSCNVGLMNFSRYQNPEVDRLIEMDRGVINPDERRHIYNRIHRLIFDDTPAVFLFFKQKLVGVSSRFGGVILSPLTFLASIKDWYQIKSKQERR